MRFTAVVLLVLLYSFVQQPLRGDVVFTFNFTDLGTGSGFDAPAGLGQARKDALQLAADIFGKSALRNYTGNIVLDASGTAPPLAAASSHSFGDPAGGGFGRTEVVRNKILSGVDLNGAAADGFVQWNFAPTTWELDLNKPVGGGDFDFYSTVYHELTHALGWSHAIVGLSGSLADSGKDGFGDGTMVGDGGTGIAGEWSKFDEFLSDGAGNRIINGATLLNNSTAKWGALQVGGASPSGGLYFDGPNASAANGGTPVGLYTPNSFQGGSSITHLDDQNPAYAGLMMLAAADGGPSARTFGAIELGILMDLGYTDIRQIQSIPETSAFLFVGVAALLGYGWKRWKTLVVRAE